MCRECDQLARHNYFIVFVKQLWQRFRSIVHSEMKLKFDLAIVHCCKIAVAILVHQIIIIYYYTISVFWRYKSATSQLAVQQLIQPIAK